MSEKTNETYHNLETIMSWIKQKPYNFQAEHGLFSYAFDWKCAAIFFGIGPASRYVKIFLDYDTYIIQLIL